MEITTLNKRDMKVLPFKGKNLSYFCKIGILSPFTPSDPNIKFLYLENQFL